MAGSGSAATDAETFLRALTFTYPTSGVHQTGEEKIHRLPGDTTAKQVYGLRKYCCRVHNKPYIICDECWTERTMNTTFFDNDGGGGAAKQEFVRRVVRTVTRAVLTKLQRAAEQETLQRATEVQNARAEYDRNLEEVLSEFPEENHNNAKGKKKKKKKKVKDCSRLGRLLKVAQTANPD